MITKRISRLAAFGLAAAFGLWILAASGESQEGMLEPAAQHKKLLADVGVWKAHCKFYMAPEAPPMEMEGTETVTQVGSFWTVATFEGDFGGMPFKGVGTSGYDPDKKKYVGTWIDSMTTSMVVMEGVEKDGWLVFEYESADMTGQPAHMRSMTKTDDSGKRIYKAYTVEEDGETLAMEITYTRKASGAR